MLFFTSDLHFGNENSIKSNNRPFKNEKSFIRKTIKNWNKLAKKNDIIYAVGDFVDCHSENDESVEYLKIVKKVKAKIILIIGNNEERVIKYNFNNDFVKFKNYCISLGFLDVKKDDVVEIDGTKFYLTHKPINHRDDMLNLFGHSHRAMGVYKSFGFHIGCDVNNYSLCSEEDIKDFLKQKAQCWDKDKNLKLI